MRVDPAKIWRAMYGTYGTESSEVYWRVHVCVVLQLVVSADVEGHTGGKREPKNWGACVGARVSQSVNPSVYILFF